MCMCTMFIIVTFFDLNVVCMYVFDGYKMDFEHIKWQKNENIVSVSTFFTARKSVFNIGY